MATVPPSVGDNVRVSQPDRTPAPMEYIDAGGAPAAPSSQRPRRRWVPYVAGAVAFLIVLVGLGLVVGDWAARNIEMRALITQVESSEAAMGDLQSNVQSIFAEYEGTSPLSPEDRAALEAKLKAAAAEGRDAIAKAGDGVAGVRWLAWHRDVRDAQDAYLAHNRAWQEYLGRAAEDPAEFGRPQDAVNDTFMAAEDPVRSALPAPVMFDLLQRVDVIFAPPESSGPGQQA